VHSFGGVSDTCRRASGCLQFGDQTASPKHLNRVAGSRAVHVAKRVAAQLADTDPMVHLFRFPISEAEALAGNRQGAAHDRIGVFGGHQGGGLRAVR
jgi:hypothetical protein